MLQLDHQELIMETGGDDFEQHRHQDVDPLADYRARLGREVVDHAMQSVAAVDEQARIAGEDHPEAALLFQDLAAAHRRAQERVVSPYTD
jgi:hypothetical protein